MRKTETIGIPARVVLALLSIGVLFIALRHIPEKTFAELGIDKLAHMSISWLLAVIFLWVFRLRYRNSGQKAKIAALMFVLALGIAWEASEFLGFKHAAVLAIPGIRELKWNYALDTALDLMFDACGAAWYLYAPEMFLASSDSDPVP